MAPNLLPLRGVPEIQVLPCHAEWFVVRSKPRKENCAVQNLVRRGIEVFFPRILEPIGWATDWTTVPLFPGYLFVRIDLSSVYYTVVWTPGVKGFVSFGDIPTPIQPGIVHFFQEEAGEDGVIRSVQRYHAGQSVRIKRGPFAGLIGIIEKPCAAPGRIRVLMDFLRRDTAVELPISAIGLR